jgi:hypothetical protein
MLNFCRKVLVALLNATEKSLSDFTQFPSLVEVTIGKHPMGGMLKMPNFLAPNSYSFCSLQYHPNKSI